jgi:hypothetical protein
MAEKSFIALVSKNSSFGTKIFPATCPKGTKALNAVCYWCPDQVLKGTAVDATTYARVHLAGSERASFYGTSRANQNYTGDVSACTEYRPFAKLEGTTVTGYTDPLGDVNLETLTGTAFYRDDASKTLLAVVEPVTGYTHSVKRGTDGANISGSGGEGVTQSGLRYWVEGKRTYSAPEVQGHYFKAWEVEDGEAEETPDGRLVVDCSGGELTAVAVYAPNPTLSYDAAGGSPVPESVTVFGEVTLAAAPAKEGYSFAGWKIGEKLCQPGEVYDLRESATAVAQWRGRKRPAVGVEIAPEVQNVALPPSVSVSIADDGDDYTEGRRVTARADEFAYDDDGRRCARFVLWEAEGVALGDDAQDLEVVFVMPDADVTLTARYAPAECVPSVRVDEASKGRVEVSILESGSLRYGDTATFKAEMSPDSGEGYSFAGWHNAAGVLVSKDRTYSVMLREDLSLTAKVAAKVELRWGVTDSSAKVVETGSHGALVLGAESANASVSGHFPLGDEVPVGFVLAEGDEGAVNGWSEGGTYMPVETVPRDDGQALLRVTKPVTLYAVYVETREKYYVSLHAYDENGNIAPSLGDFSMVSASGGKVAEMGQPEWEAASRTTSRGAGRFYEVDGPQTVRVRVYQTGQIPFSGHEWRSYAASSDGGGSQTQGAAAELLHAIGGLNRTSYLKATFSVRKSVRVTLRHEERTPGVIARGSFELEGARDVATGADGYDASGEYDVGGAVSATAHPANGWKFKEWRSADGFVSAAARYEFSAPAADSALVAVFEPDEVGILEWEGSDENFEAEWTSRVYVTPRPFDPVAARVDATGYPVSLSVGTCSSPDAAPTRDHSISVADQRGRRLPRMRPERFVRIAVASAHEVDAVIVGTNMAEVN